MSRELTKRQNKPLPPLPPGVGPDGDDAEPDAELPEDGEHAEKVEFVESWLRIDGSSVSADRVKEIEEDIVAELVARHKRWFQYSATEQEY